MLLMLVSQSKADHTVTVTLNCVICACIPLSCVTTAVQYTPILSVDLWICGDDVEESHLVHRNP